MLNNITNQSHKVAQKGYFEWWYFHFVCTGGIQINIVLHETDIFGLIQTPYISVSLLFYNKFPRYYRRALTPLEIIMQDKGKYLIATDNLFKEDEEKLCFCVQIDDLRFSGCIHKQSPPAIIKNGILFKDNNSQQMHCWIIQIPYGILDAELELKGINYSSNLHGFAYHDHNWGTALIQNHFKNWLWGFFCDSQKAISFYRIATLRGDIIDRTFLLLGKNIFTSTTLNTSVLNYLSTIQNPEKVNLDSEVDFSHYCNRLKFYLRNKNLMRKKLSESYQDFLSTYCRWYVLGELSCLKKKYLLHGVTEYLQIRRAKL